MGSDDLNFDCDTYDCPHYENHGCGRKIVSIQAGLCAEYDFLKRTAPEQLGMRPESQLETFARIEVDEVTGSQNPSGV